MEMAQQKLPPELEEKLASLECPFNWTQVFTPADLLPLEENDFYGRIRGNLDTSNDDDFVEYGFPSGICLIHEYITKGEEAHNTVKEVIDICETKLNSVFVNRKNHSLLRKARLAFVHVLQSCKAYFERHYGTMETLQDVLKDIPDHNIFNQDTQACINGIKAVFLLTYGPYKTTEIGVQCAEKAIELDSTEGWYYFLVGKGLYRHRRAVNRNELPSDKEINFMEHARQLEFKRAESDIFLIEMYSEMLQKRKCTKEYLNKTTQLCRSIYEDAEEWSCLWRCARGLNRIRNLDQQCINLGLQCLEKANRLSPNNPEIMFLMSQFYESKKHDLRNALHYAQLATECGGMMPMFVSQLVRLMYLNDNSKNLIPVFDKLISKMQTAFNQHVSMCLKARYVLQERQHDLKIALDIFIQILQEDPNCLLQEEPKRNKQLYNLMPILFSDIQAAVRKLSHCNKDDRHYCESKLAELKQLYPVLEKIKPLQTYQRQWWNTYYNK